MEILSRITHPYVVQNPARSLLSSEHKLRFFWWTFWLHRQQRNYCVEPGCTVPCFKQRKMHSVHKTVFVNMSEGFGRKDGLQFFSQPYLKQNIQTMNKERWMFDIRMLASASWYSHECASKTGREKTKLLNNYYIVFFAHKKYSHSFIKYGWITDVTWTILTMSLPPFWALNVSVAVLSTQGQKAHGFHPQYLYLCSNDERKSHGFGTTWMLVINTFFSYY